MKRLLPILLMALLVGACGTATPSESPSVSPSESPMAEVTPTPSAPPSEAPATAFTEIALTTPLNLTSGFFDEMTGNRLTPVIAADSERVYFVASTSAPLTKGKYKRASEHGTYRVFAYDPTTTTLSYLETIVDPSYLSPAVISDDPADVSTTSATSGFCATGTEDYRNFPNVTDYFYSAGALKAYPLVVNGEDVGASDYEAPLDCETRWAGYDGEESGPWDDFEKKGHPAAVCPPDVSNCDLGDRQSRDRLYAVVYGPRDQANSGRAPGTIAIYANGLAAVPDRESAPDPDELRYYNQATGMTGSILLDGKPLSGWATDAYVLGGQYYLLVQPYEGVTTFRSPVVFWDEGPWQLVRIDPANPGVAIPVTTLH